MSNDTTRGMGRFGNHFFRNMYAHFMAKKYNLKFVYSLEDKFKELGIEFFKDGENYYDTTIIIKDEESFSYLENDMDLKTNIYINEMYSQNKKFCLYLKDYFYQEDNKNKIMKTNKYSYRYNSNNDVFIHVRLDDISSYNPGFNYYDKILSKLDFKDGYITSDSIHHPICQQLISKYNLYTFEENDIDTIMFGSTCKHIILSHGSYSFLMGFFGFFSDIYYPEIVPPIWYGDIYAFPEWKCMEW